MFMPSVPQTDAAVAPYAIGRGFDGVLTMACVCCNKQLWQHDPRFGVEYHAVEGRRHEEYKAMLAPDAAAGQRAWYTEKCFLQRFPHEEWANVEFVGELAAAEWGDGTCSI